MAGMNSCDDCRYFDYDEESDSYFCDMDLDEDEMERFLRRATAGCPFYHRGDEYETARRQ